VVVDLRKAESVFVTLLASGAIQVGWIRGDEAHGVVMDGELAQALGRDLLRIAHERPKSGPQRGEIPGGRAAPDLRDHP
jgi:hypothetical protein